MEIRVRYEVTFDAFDLALAELGRNWHSHVNVHGFDGGDELGADIPAAVFDRVDFDVNADTTSIPQDVKKTVARSVLQEDPAGNPDELKVRVRIHSNQNVVEYLEEVSDPGGPDQRPLTSRTPGPQAGAGYPRCRPEGTLLVSVAGPAGSLIGAALSALADSVRTEEARKPSDLRKRADQ